MEAAVVKNNSASALQPPSLLEAGVPTDEELAPCPNCGRTFVQSSLQRHAVACSKNTNSRRGKFDSSKQRIQGTELEQYLPPPVKQRPRSRSVPGGPRRSLIPQQPLHEKCEYCGRSFGEKAIERHRDWCKNQKTIMKQTATPPSPAFSRMQARTQYKAPLAKTLRSRTREKYSPGAAKESNKTSAPTSKRSSVSHTPTKTTTKAAYDVFQSAERQMQELLGSPLPSRKSQPYVIKQKADIEVNLDEKFIKSEETNSLNGHDSADEDDEPDAAEEESSIEEALHEISHQDSFSSVEIFKDELDEKIKAEEQDLEIRHRSSSIFDNKLSSPDEDNKIKEALMTIKHGVNEAFKEPQVDHNESLTEEDVLNHLKATLEGTLDNCPLTESLNYLDAALSLFQLDDIPTRPTNAPRSKASTKRRQYSVASPLSLLKPDPDRSQHQCSECGTAFPMPTAKFCCLCGTKRSV